MSAADDLRAFIAPLLPGWRLQFGRWTDDPERGGAYRYAVLKPAGGPLQSVVRNPAFTLTLIGAAGEEAQVPFAAAETVIKAMQDDMTYPLAMQPGEPSYFPTSDGRPIAELAISTITD